MFKQILVPLDGSSLAERALPLAVSLAGDSLSKLILYRVVPYFTVLAADPLLYEEMNRMGEDEAIAYLRQVRESLPGHLDVETACEVGSAADAVLQFAQDRGVDLIVMSSHGRSGINRWVYGSVAERVLSQSSCPTLILNASQAPWSSEAKALLVPLDGSKLAEKALAPAQEIAVRLGLIVHLLRVTTTGRLRREADQLSERLSTAKNEEDREAQAYLELIGQSWDLTDVRCAVEEAGSSVAEAIINYAMQHNIDLIVMSTHGRTGIRRWVYGSVTEKVLRSGCCATMTVRNQ